MVRRKGAIESEMRSAHVKSFGGKKVDDVGCSSECISPVRGGHGCLEEESSGGVVDGAKHAFGFAILLGGVRARHSQGNTFGKEERAGGRVVKFTAIITLYRLDRTTKLSMDIGEEV
jgi:hypothetical protein